MRFRHAPRGSGEKIELQMTPMIDIVFQLLVFFIMTFKIVAQEGDFNVKMPQQAPQEVQPDIPEELPPMTLRLRAAADGSLDELLLNQQSFGRDFARLNQHIITLIGGASGAPSSGDAEVEIDSDPNLHYRHVIDAISAVSGYVDRETGEIVRLIERFKFKPRAGGG